MKTTLTPGLEHSVTFDVTREQTIDFMGEQARVYATPMLVRDIEVACRNLLLQHLDPGEDSVGTRVAIDHIAATLLGMPVTLTVRIQAVEGRADFAPHVEPHLRHHDGDEILRRVREPARRIGAGPAELARRGQRGVVPARPDHRDTQAEAMRAKDIEHREMRRALALTDPVAGHGLDRLA